MLESLALNFVAKYSETLTVIGLGLFVVGAAVADTTGNAMFGAAFA